MSLYILFYCWLKRGHFKNLDAHGSLTFHFLSSNAMSSEYYAFRCMLHNFAGNIEMYGYVDSVGSRPIDARLSENSTMASPLNQTPVFQLTHVIILPISKLIFVSLHRSSLSTPFRLVLGCQWKALSRIPSFTNSCPKWHFDGTELT